MHELWTLNKKDNLLYNITPMVGSLSWRSNINELGEQLDFDITFNDDRYFPINPVDIGNIIILQNGQNEIYRGVLISEQKNGRKPIVYNSFDYAFYLNKSKSVYQFNKVNAKVAIGQICKHFNIPVGNIVDIPFIVNEIYVDKILSDIIKNILKMAEENLGTKYRIEMRQGKLYIEKQEDLLIKGTFKLATNLDNNNIVDAISNPQRKRSIEDMRNSIKIISDNKIVAQLKNFDLINQYGILQDVFTVDSKDVGKANTIAQNMLNDLGKIFEDNSLDMLGDDNVRAGRLIEIVEPVTGMSGKYLIKDVKHNVRNGIHYMSLGLGVI